MSNLEKKENIFLGYLQPKDRHEMIMLKANDFYDLAQKQAQRELNLEDFHAALSDTIALIESKNRLTPYSEKPTISYSLGPDDKDGYIIEILNPISRSDMYSLENANTDLELHVRAGKKPRFKYNDSASRLSRRALCSDASDVLDSASPALLAFVKDIVSSRLSKADFQIAPEVVHCANAVMAVTGDSYRGRGYGYVIPGECFKNTLGSFLEQWKTYSLTMKAEFRKHNGYVRF